MKLKVWLDSGANCHSKYSQVIEVDQDEWESMTEDEKEEYAKEIAFDRADWGYSTDLD